MSSTSEDELVRLKTDDDDNDRTNELSDTDQRTKLSNSDRNCQRESSSTSVENNVSEQTELRNSFPANNSSSDTTNITDATIISSAAHISASDRNNSDSSIVTFSSSTASAGPTRLPGTYPPEWLPDHEANSCMSCDSIFTLIKRRHHCRSCGKIFCSDCCRQKAKLLHLDNKEARVCSNCFYIIECTQVCDLSSNSGQDQATSGLIEPTATDNSSRMGQTASNHHGNQSMLVNEISQNQIRPLLAGTSTPTSSRQLKYHSVLKSTSGSGNSRSSNDGIVPCSSSSSAGQQQQSATTDKQVIFSDGIRPGTDLTESFTYPTSSLSSATGASSIQMTFPILARQTKAHADVNHQASSGKKQRSSRHAPFSSSNTVTVCDELGYLPPVVLTRGSKLFSSSENHSNPGTSQISVGSLSNLIMSQFKIIDTGRSPKASTEPRVILPNGVVKFEEIVDLTSSDGQVTFLLLRDYYLKVKIVSRLCPSNGSSPFQDQNFSNIARQEDATDSLNNQENPKAEYWCFASDGLSCFGQQEVVIILDKDSDSSCVPRDVFKIYVTLHELALRRQTLGNLGNLLFQDGLFDNRDNAGLIFIKALESHSLENLIIPDKPFLIALVLQRCEIPWSKVFPVRLLLRLGHNYNTFPYPIVSYRNREPVYYEVGHTIISILGDFRNYRYSLTHVDGLKVMINRSTKRVLIQLDESSYPQFNKVLDSSNNEHVLAWSSYPFLEADGHMVCVQNEEGNYETTEFYKNASNFANYQGFPDETDPNNIIGASFVIFSGALKANQTGQPAKISIVEDGLLIQVQSCTMSALKSAIHFMHHFDIDCETDQDPLNSVEINWFK